MIKGLGGLQLEAGERAECMGAIPTTEKLTPYGRLPSNDALTRFEGWDGFPVWAWEARHQATRWEADAMPRLLIPASSTTSLKSLESCYIVAIIIFRSQATGHHLAVGLSSEGILDAAIADSDLAAWAEAAHGMTSR